MDTAESFWSTQGWCLLNNVISAPIAIILMYIVYVFIKRHTQLLAFTVWWVLKVAPSTDKAHGIKHIIQSYKRIKDAIRLAHINLVEPITFQGSPCGFPLHRCSKNFYRRTMHLYNALVQNSSIVQKIQNLKHYDSNIKTKFETEWIKPYNESFEVETKQEEFDTFYMPYHDFMCIFGDELNKVQRMPPLS